MRHILFSLVALSGLSACTHHLGRAQPKTAGGLYAQGVEDLEAGLFPEALKEFAEVKTQFPYSHYAALAELRTADAHYRRNKYLEAIDGYRTFLKFHPNHDQAAYALFQVGEAYFEQIPNDWWFLPPGAEKDPTNTRLAIVAYQDMLSRFGSGFMADQARERLAACRRKLADHEMYVARFYMRLDHFLAAAARAETVLHEYSGLDLDAEALWIAGKAYLNAGEMARARSALEDLLNKFPQNAQVGAARSLLERIRSASPPDGAKTYPAAGPHT